MSVDPYTGMTTVSGPASAGWVGLLMALAYFLAFSLWQLYRQGTTGQTIGKRVVHIVIQG